MSEGTVSASPGNHSENVRDLVRALPAWMPKDDESGNFKLLDVVGRAFDRLDEDIRDTDLAASLQDAQSIAEIERIASVVNTPPKQNEPIEKYRTRVIGEFQLLTNEGTISDLLINAGVLLGIEPSKMGYELLEPGYSTLKVPGSAIESLSVTDEEFADIMTRQSAAGYRIDIQKKGTFTYLTPSDYSSGTFNPDFGYDGLDSNGDPKDNGGTYSGVL